jgi:hypothetical protein
MGQIVGVAAVVAMVGVVVAFILLQIKAQQNANLHQEADQRRQAQAEAASVLPPGVEDTWKAYVDRRFAAAIQRRGDVVAVAVQGNGSGEEATTLVSRNTPYRIDCPRNFREGLSIDFGGADDAGLVLIYGHFVRGELIFPGRRHGEKPPPLGVDPRSVAATDLSRVLCERIAVKIQQVMNLADDAARGSAAIRARRAAGQS